MMIKGLDPNLTTSNASFKESTAETRSAQNHKDQKKKGDSELEASKVLAAFDSQLSALQNKTSGKPAGGSPSDSLVESLKQEFAGKNPLAKPTPKGKQERVTSDLAPTLVKQNAQLAEQAKGALSFPEPKVKTPFVTTTTPQVNRQASEKPALVDPLLTGKGLSPRNTKTPFVSPYVEHPQQMMAQSEVAPKPFSKEEFQGVQFKDTADHVRGIGFGSSKPVVEQVVQNFKTPVMNPSPAGPQLSMMGAAPQTNEIPGALIEGGVGKRSEFSELPKLKILRTNPNQMSGSDFVTTQKAVKKNPVATDNSEISFGKFENPRGSAVSQIKARDPELNLTKLNLPASKSGFNVPQALINPQPVLAPKVKVDGHVVLGRMASERFSTQALNDMSSGINRLAVRGGGEMQIQLHPENLGQLNLRVSTAGNQVGLRIQAADSRAQKVLEESIPYLQNKLASQNLNLSKVDVMVKGMPTEAATIFVDSNSDSQRSQPSHPTSQQFDSLLDTNRQGDQRGSHGWVGDLDEETLPGPSKASPLKQGAQSQQSSSVSSSRLDVRA